MLANTTVHVSLVKSNGMSFVEAVGYPHTLELNTMQLDTSNHLNRVQFSSETGSKVNAEARSEKGQGRL